MSGNPLAGSRGQWVVYRTTTLHDADVVAEAMGRAQIPFLRRVETLGGLSVAMPVNPEPGLLPGNFWVIVVPGRWSRRARKLIARLPVSQENRDTHRMPGVPEMFQGWTWVFVLAIVVALVVTLLRMYME